MAAYAMEKASAHRYPVRACTSSSSATLSKCCASAASSASSDLSPPANWSSTTQSATRLPAIEKFDLPYFHVVYTLPAAIADIAYQNKAVIYNLLFKAAAETTLTIAADPKHLGARIGFMSVLHTWGSALTHHPHVHMVVPGGGPSPDGSKWIACRPRYFLTVQVLSALFRRLFLRMLLAAHHADRLRFFGDHVRLADKAAFKAYLRPLRQIDWVVYAKEPFAEPQQVLRYLSRYPTASRSPIAGCCPPTTTASPSRTRIIGSTGRPAIRR